ncbi:unnamed protein product [Cuscuta europaea]|uniref:Nuclease associated modular domain-containing protein n=1 Tax=Cuscuta europaea TaxID=41803 RepID=A0A9P0Z6K7_CUSEU|nr:unnamed protein product [Cuscuta europaea]
MSLLDIAYAGFVFQNDLCAVNCQIVSCSKYYSWNGIRLSSLRNSSFCLLGKTHGFGGLKLYRGELKIRAVATLEKESTKANQIKQDGAGYKRSIVTSIDSGSLSCSVNESTELDKREKLRRGRISKANKGKTPWNKGRKHSPETLQKIRERTWIAMQDPKVKMKLSNLGHVQSKQTRLKIGISVQLGWKRRQKMLKLQETCCYEWQNLIAETSRKGLLGEEELEWDSYHILDQQLEEDWSQGLLQRKKTLKSEGNNRAPKSTEQRRKISEAISAKWADPDYRKRVCSGLAKHHGEQEGVERKPRKRPSGDGQTRIRKSSSMKKINIDGSTICITEQRIKRDTLKRSYTPKSKDSLTRSRLELLINIRSRRAVANNKKFEAVKRAKLLIAEAEKAAEALEIAATKSLVARASLVETRKLIAEAVQSINFIDDTEEMFPDAYEGAHVDDSVNAEEIEGLDSEIEDRKMNEVQLANNEILSLKFTDNSSHGLKLNGNKTAILSSSRDYDLLLDCKEKLYQTVSGDTVCDTHDDEANKMEDEEERSNKMTLHHYTLPINGMRANAPIRTKQWVRGRLVEVST